MLTMVATLLPDGTVSFINISPLEIAGLAEADVINKKLWEGPISANLSHQPID